MVSDEEFTRLCDVVARMAEDLRFAKKQILFQTSRADALEVYVLSKVDGEPYKTRKEAQDALNRVTRLVHDDRMKALEDRHPGLAARWDIREDLEGTEDYDRWLLPREGED